MRGERQLVSLRSRFRRGDMANILEHGPAERVCPSCGSRNKAWRRYCADCEADLEPRAGTEESFTGSRLEGAIRRSRDAAARRTAAAKTAAEQAKTEDEKSGAKKGGGLSGLRPALAAEGLVMAMANPVHRVIAVLCGAMIIFALAFYGLASRRHPPTPSSFEVQAAAPTIPPPNSPLAPTPQLAGAPAALPALPQPAVAARVEPVSAPIGAFSRHAAVRRHRHHGPSLYCIHGGRVCVRRIPAWRLY